MGSPSRKSHPAESMLRIIGGTMRGRKFIYSGDPGTRPMKDRVREAVFNLVGTAVKNTVAVDLFAGTGAMALEAISRGALSAVACERNFKMADSLRQNAESLGLKDRVQVHAGNTFIWHRKNPTIPGDTWTVFCCPPYALYQEQPDEMVELIDGLIQRAPAGSNFVVEADRHFDFQVLPHADAWDVRSYPPAMIGVYFK